MVRNIFERRLTITGAGESLGRDFEEVGFNYLAARYGRCLAPRGKRDRILRYGRMTTAGFSYLT
jgi:hypothetical protein